MLLRTKIFRQLVFFALIPSLIIAAVGFYFLLETIKATGLWMSTASPDRTINSLRLTEARLQESAAAYLAAAGDTATSPPDSLFDWWLVAGPDGTVRLQCCCRLSPGIDSALRTGIDRAGMIRRVVDDHLILGAAKTGRNGITAAGFLLDREYLRGFQAVSESLTESRRFQNLLPGYIMFLLAGVALVLLLIVVAAYVLSRRLSASITNPLERLTAATAAMIIGRRESLPLAATGTEEVARLTETFNRMMLDLEESRKRLMAAERVAAWQGFARRMAHELKNPLTPIALSLYRIKTALAESGHYAQVADSIEAISAEVGRLERLATDYASLAKLPAPEFKTIEFTRLTRDLITLHSAQLQAFTFEQQIPGEELPLVGDPDHLQQVMVNMLKNAVEFSPPGGRIAVTVTGDARTVSFAVTNEGKDVDEKALESAKMPYFSTRRGGSGLGLAISEKIIIDHGGSLTIGLENGMTVARFEIPARGPARNGENTHATP